MDRRLFYRIDGQKLHLYLEGDYTVDEYLGFVERAMQDPGLPQKIAILTDARHSRAKRSREEVTRIVSHFRQWIPRIICLAVVVSMDYQFAVAREASSQSEYDGLIARPFREQASAVRWIETKLRRTVLWWIKIDGFVKIPPD